MVWTMVNSGAWSSSLGHPGSDLGATEARATWLSTLAAESSCWDGGDGVDVDEANDGDGDRDRDDDGDADADRVMVGTVSLLANDGTTTSPAGPSRPNSSAVLVGLETIDSEAAVTNWVKLAGPLALVVVGFSCLVDHWRRCW
jgi:hypothetical protein